MRITTLMVLVFAICLPVPVQAAVGDPPPPIEKGLLDCSLYRYGSQFDAAVARTLKRMADATSTDPTLKAAFEGATRQDVTDRFYQLELLYRVTDCPQPVVRGYAGARQVVLQVSALQSPVCEQLVSSETLRLSGLVVEPLHVPSGELRCGLARNQVPGLLTLGRLTQAGRSLPGENTVTVIASGPFAEPAPVVGRPPVTPACPSETGRPDPVIEDLLAKQSVVHYDLPRNWKVEPCIDIIGGPSSLGMTCNVANWNNYQQRLYDEFERIMGLAEASGDPERIYSAAYWLIDQNDPFRMTILSFDYPGQDCDAIRNRILTGWGACIYNKINKAAKDNATDWLQGKKNIPQVKANMTLKSQESVMECFMDRKKYLEYYNDADKLLNDWLRPMPAPEKRQQLMVKVQQRVRSAMANSGYGDCEYYADAVVRLDQVIWRDQYRSGVAQLPVDWDHDFWKSARTCARDSW